MRVIVTLLAVMLALPASAVTIKVVAGKERSDIQRFVAARKLINTATNAGVVVNPDGTVTDPTGLLTAQKLRRILAAQNLIDDSGNAPGTEGDGAARWTFDGPAPAKDTCSTLGQTICQDSGTTEHDSMLLLNGRCLTICENGLRAVSTD